VANSKPKVSKTSKLVVLGLVVCASREALAVAVEPCASVPARPKPSVAIEVAAADEHLVNEVESELGAALGARGIALCVGSAATASLVARVSILMETAGATPVAQIRIGDEITRKRVERSMELGLLPPDGWALAIASSADELLRASWAELMLRDAPSPPRAAPPPIAEAVAASARRPARRYELSADGGGATGRDRSALTIGARLGYAVAPRVAIFGAATSSFGAERESPHGNVRADDLGFEAGLAGGLTLLSDRRGLRFEGGLAILRMSFVASPAPGVAALSFADWSVVSLVRARGWISIGASRISLAGGVSYPVRAARALDGEVVVTSNEGVTALASLGVGWGY
jgi:hypothetical protein